MEAVKAKRPLDSCTFRDCESRACGWVRSGRTHGHFCREGVIVYTPISRRTALDWIEKQFQKGKISAELEARLRGEVAVARLL
jgi:hypothetical protein